MTQSKRRKAAPAPKPKTKAKAKTKTKAKTSQRASTGSRLKLDEATQQAICDNLRMGMTKPAAAAGAGISKDTFFDWMRKGRDKGAPKPFKDFVAAVDQAVDDFEARAVKVISKYAFEGWEAETLTVKTIKDKEGKPTGQVEVTKKTEQKIPDLDRLQWLLERRREGYARKEEVDFNADEQRPLVIRFIKPGEVKKPGTGKRTGNAPPA